MGEEASDLQLHRSKNRKKTDTDEGDEGKRHPKRGENHRSAWRWKKSSAHMENSRVGADGEAEKQELMAVVDAEEEEEEGMGM